MNRCRARVYTKWDPNGLCMRNRIAGHDHYCWQHARLAIFGTVSLNQSQRSRMEKYLAVKADSESEK